ncbi:MAG: TrbC/VirB2 family protein [Candidatus Omnitrophica bacterium]|nr:TrbC/VirB2 family protein [Candidatus Omnitrophota bacterium]
MKLIKQWYKAPAFKSFLILMLLMVLTSQNASADLISSMDDLQSKIKTICNPLAIIFLIVAGWQKAMGNSQMFILALIGTVVMFGAPQIVNFISASFGG